MSRTALSKTRAACAIGAAVALCLGLTACSLVQGEPDANPSKSSKSPEAVDYEEVAAGALVSTELETLSDHKPKEDEPSTFTTGEAPFYECPYDRPKSFTMKASAQQWFKGEPEIVASAYAVEDSAAKVFADLRDIWDSKECRSYFHVMDDIDMNFERTQEIKAPKGIDADSWFGACFEGHDDARKWEAADCRVIYLVDDRTFVELESFQSPDENEINAAFLTLVAAEALSG